MTDKQERVDALLLELRKLIHPLTRQGEDRIWRPAEKACAIIDMLESTATHPIITEQAEKIARLAEALGNIFAKLDHGPSGPGHGHGIPGVWDDDISNGKNAGKPCEWCAQWEAARAALEPTKA